MKRDRRILNKREAAVEILQRATEVKVKSKVAHREV